MNCVELQQSLVRVEDGSDAEQRAHLKNCPECSALVADLNLIASSAVQLRDNYEPSPCVWNSLEIALRQEGLIHPPRNRSLLSSIHTPAWVRWMAPVAAAVLIVVGIYVRSHSPVEQIASNASQPTINSPRTEGGQADLVLAGLKDDDLMQELSQQSPALRAQFSDNLRRVNEYIQDEQKIITANPDDEEAHRALMEAYEQKSMLFELALDRSMQ
jgi:hypothetical protein